MDKARLFYFSNAQCQQNGNGEDLDINIFLIPSIFMHFSICSHLETRYEQSTTQCKYS